MDDLRRAHQQCPSPSDPGLQQARDYFEKALAHLNEATDLFGSHCRELHLLSDESLALLAQAVHHHGEPDRPSRRARALSYLQRTDCSFHSRVLPDPTDRSPDPLGLGVGKLYVISHHSDRQIAPYRDPGGLCKRFYAVSACKAVCGYHIGTQFQPLLLFHGQCHSFHGVTFSLNS